MAAQQSAAPTGAEVQVDPRQQFFIVRGFNSDSQVGKASPAADEMAVQAVRDRRVDPDLLDDSDWRQHSPPGERMPWENRDVADATRLGNGASTDANSQSAAADTIPPRVDEVLFHGGPQRGDTYTAGNRINVWILFDEDVRLRWSIPGPPPVTLALQMGAETRQMSANGCVNSRPGAPRCGGPVGGIAFVYDVQETDHDPDGVSIASDALRLNGMRIHDEAGNDANLNLGPHAIGNDPAHKVNGGLDHPPMIKLMTILYSPQRNDTFGREEEIVVILETDENVTVTGEPTIALTIGSDTREAVSYGTTSYSNDYISFHYRVQATDKDANGLSIRADALRLSGGSIRDARGNDLMTNLAAVAITDDPRYKVDGTVDWLPGIDQVGLYSRPQNGDTYGPGETIEVRISFDADVSIRRPTGRPALELTLQIGGEERRVEGVTSFRYEVKTSDYDPDGISIAPDALRLLEGATITGPFGRNVTDLTLGEHAVTNHPAHKVDGRELVAVGTLPPLELVAGGEAATVDVSQAFVGRVTAYAAESSSAEVAAVSVSDAELTVSPVAEGTVTIEVTARNETETATQAFVVTVIPALEAVGTLPPLELVAGGEAATVDVSQAFVGRVTAYAAESSSAEVAAVSVSDAELTVSPVAEGTATIEVTARNETETATLTFVVTVVPALVAVGTLPPLELVAGGEAATVDVSQAFVGRVTAYAAESSSAEVAAVSVSDAELTVSPVAEGTVTIEVTARNATETATQAFVVTVIPALEAVGTLPPLELIAGGAAATVDVARAFRGRVATYAAESSNPEAATVAVSGAELTVSPVVEGTATIEVTARNATEMATQAFMVTVVTDAAEVRVLENTLAAFGRSLLASVTMTIEGRFEAAPGGMAIAVAGHQLPVGTVAAEQHTGIGATGRSIPVPVGAVADAVRGQAGAFPGGPSPGRLSGDDLLRGSHFTLALGAAQPEGAEGGGGARWTVWGNGDLQSFAGEPENGAGYDGHTRTGHVGVDVGGERWLAGAAVSRSSGRADYRFSGDATGSGRLAMTLTSVQPYLRFAPRRGTAVWTILGAGGGMVENVRPHVGDRREQSDLSMWLGVVGGRQTLASVGRVELALRGDVGVLGLEAGDDAEAIGGLSATVQRYRVGVETSHTTRWARGATLTPFAVVGARYDGGAGQTGSGLELEGGIRLADASTGFGLEARGRVLTLHTTGQHRERGVSVTALWTPGGTVDRGLSVAVTPRWGAAAGGADALWRQQAFGRERLALSSDEARSVDARVGYGLALRAGRVLTPFSELGVQDDDHRRLRVGLRLTGAAHTRAPLHVELSGERANAGWGRVDHRLALYGALSF